MVQEDQATGVGRICKGLYTSEEGFKVPPKVK